MAQLAHALPGELAPVLPSVGLLAAECCVAWMPPAVRRAATLLGIALWQVHPGSVWLPFAKLRARACDVLGADTAASCASTEGAVDTLSNTRDFTDATQRDVSISGLAPAHAGTCATHSLLAKLDLSQVAATPNSSSCVPGSLSVLLCREASVCCAVLSAGSLPPVL